MPPRMLEQWLTSEDRAELQAYYLIQEEREAARKAAEITDSLARRGKR